MRKKSIPDNVREKVLEVIERFNKKTFHGVNCYYIARFQGKFLYLDRNDYGQIGPICRLKYKGEIDNWDFAIFKWSSETYDPDEWMFPGSEYVDGTVNVAMKAGLEAYQA